MYLEATTNDTWLFGRHDDSDVFPWPASAGAQRQLSQLVCECSALSIWSASCAEQRWFWKLRWLFSKSAKLNTFILYRQSLVNTKTQMSASPTMPANDNAGSVSLECKPEVSITWYRGILGKLLKVRWNRWSHLMVIEINVDEWGMEKHTWTY